MTFNQTTHRAHCLWQFARIFDERRPRWITSQDDGFLIKFALEGRFIVYAPQGYGGCHPGALFCIGEGGRFCQYHANASSKTMGKRKMTGKKKAVESRNVIVKVSDGAIISGQVNLESEEGRADRVSDLLTKRKTRFLVVYNAQDMKVSGEEASVVILNKDHILWVIPQD